MSADHKRPLLAFVLVTIACLLIVVNAARSEAVRSALQHGADRVAAGVRLALEDDDPAHVAATAPRSFDRDDEGAAASHSLPPATILLPAPAVTLPSTSAASVVARQHAVRVPRAQAAPGRGHASSRAQQGRQALRPAKAGHPRATAVKHATGKAEHATRGVDRAAHPRTTSGHDPRAVGHSPAQAAPHRSPAHATSGHRTSSRFDHARAHHRSQHRSHHRGERHHRR